MRRGLLSVLMVGGSVQATAQGVPPADHPPGWRTTITRSATPLHTTVHGADPSWRASVVRLPASQLQTGSLPARKGPAPALPSLTGLELQGIASYYWQEQMTSSGERFDRHALTAAHKTLPFDTRIKVTHVASGRSVVVRVNDRGPFQPGRIIDLSEAAAGVLGFRGQGLAHVRLEVLR